MGRKRTPGLYKRGQYWQIDKKVHGCRICESTGTSDLGEAEKYLAFRCEEIRKACVYGVRPKRTFRQAATKYLLENKHKCSIDVDARQIKILDTFIGKVSLDDVHMGSLQSYIQERKQKGVKARTINYGLQVVRQVMNQASSEWVDEFGLTWLATAPKIKLLPETDKRRPYPLSREEQTRLIKELPLHLQRMLLFAVNTGCRDAEVCNLQWRFEVPVPELNTSIFVIPGYQGNKRLVKNGEDRLVVLNRVARSVIDSVRGAHSEYVFVYKGHRINTILTSAWKRARERAGLSQVRVHDLKHTFGRRLRAAGVCFEDRQDLLGHKSQRITTHYSAAELSNLLRAANSVCDDQTGSPTLTLIDVSCSDVAERAS